MKDIHTLIPDIQALVQRKDGWFNDEVSHALEHNLSSRLGEHFNQERYAPGKGYLRMSGLGPRCPRALWYSIHHPELAEPLPASAEIKFAYGHVIEALAIALAKSAGHEITGEQDEVRLDGVVGHRDCVIDGCIVDVKSTSSRGFEKFKNRTLWQDDSFGYLDQLDGYVVASRDDPFVKVKDRGYLLAVDKTLGHMVIYEHIVREESIRQRIADYKRVVTLDNPPPCCCGTQPDGASGNVRLDTRASYSAYKFCCFPHLRTFLYKTGPIYLSKVIRKPDVKEINRDGKVVYN